jgi:hypothetical protein
MLAMAPSTFTYVRLALVAILLLVVTTDAASTPINASKAAANNHKAREIVSAAEYTVDNSVLTVTVTKTRYYHDLPKDQSVAKRDVVRATSAEPTTLRPLTGIGASINTERPPKGMSALSGQPTGVVSAVSVSWESARAIQRNHSSFWDNIADVRTLQTHALSSINAEYASKVAEQERQFSAMSRSMVSGLSSVKSSARSSAREAMVTQVYNWNYWCQTFIRDARNGSLEEDVPQVADTGTVFVPGVAAATTVGGPAARCTDLLECYRQGK